MRKGKSLKSSTKTKYKKKIVIEDTDLNVIIAIPISQDEKMRKEVPQNISSVPRPVGKPDEERIDEVLSHDATEKLVSGQKETLELYLIKLFKESPTEISCDISKDVIIPFQPSPLDHISPVKHSFRRLTEITSLNVKKDIYLKLDIINNIKSIQESIPSIRFEEPELVKMLNIEKLINTKIEFSTRALGFITPPRTIFCQPYSIRPKEVYKEVGAKTSELLALVSSIKSVQAGNLIEQEDVLKRVFGTTLFKMIIDRPFLILAKKPRNEKFEYIEFLKRILRELYRIYASGLPNPFDLRTEFRDVKPSIRASKHIYVIDLKEANINENDLKYLTDRLRELYSQSLGFLIFYGDNEELNKIKDLWKPAFPQAEFIGKIQQPIEISIREDLKVYNLVNLMWGKVLDYQKIEETYDLDSWVVISEERFYKKIWEIVSDIRTIIKVEPSKKDDERLDGESLLHYGTKAFVVRYLIDHENIPDYNIFTEYSVGDIIPDIFVRQHPKHGDLVIEIETLYGTTIPLLKLRKTIDSRLSKGLRLWIVIPNPQLLLFLSDIAKLRHVYQDKYPDSIEFFTLDIYSQKLIPLPEIMKRIKSIINA